jgi:hypothetical protein
MNSAAVRTEEATEQQLNDYFAELSLDEAMEHLVYLTNESRYRSHTTISEIKEFYFKKSLGSLLKKHDPTAFYVEMSC